ncbi:MAG: alpha/beta hydrolase [Prosthecobacter sp.]|uniref:alpha/beta hydrolase n=1 Tax=Prosthecobacter sp. TaxID=1965333 RepID=UPI003903AC98
MIFRHLALVLALSITALHAETVAPDSVRVLTDVPYKQGDALSDYEKERCKLDVYLPKAGKDFATLVWFHGGGLTNGDKNGQQIKSDSVKTAQIARSLATAGIAVVSPNYRLSPKARFPAYIQDAAAAVAWTQAHITEHGGDATKVFVGGHSAGGYLTLMLGMDAHYLADAGVKLAGIAGFIPVSGQTMTHYTIRAERGEPKNAITADEAAPVHFVRADTPPFLVLYADRDMAARAEENAFFAALMRGVGNKRVTSRMIKDRTHGSIASEIEKDGDPARVAILEFIQANGVKR